MTCNLITAHCVASRGKSHLRSSLLEVWTSIPCCLGPNCFTISWSYKIMCSLKDLCICWDCGKVLNTRIRPTVPWGSLLGRKTNGVWDWVYGIVYFVLPPYECHWKSANIQIPLLLQERRGVVGSEFLGLITRKPNSYEDRNSSVCPLPDKINSTVRKVIACAVASVQEGTSRPI